MPKAIFIALLSIIYFSSCIAKKSSLSDEPSALDQSGLIKLTPSPIEQDTEAGSPQITLKFQSNIAIKPYLFPDEESIVEHPFSITALPQLNSRPMKVAAQFRDLPTNIWEINVTSKQVRNVPFSIAKDGKQVEFGMIPSLDYVYFPIRTSSTTEMKSFDPRAFSIIENSDGKIVLRIGRLHRIFDNYLINVYAGSKKIHMALRASLAEGGFVSFTVPENGFYRVEITNATTHSGQNLFTLWKQNILAQHKSRKLWDDDSIALLAKKFAPVVMFHDEEDYFPVSLPYLLNQENPAPELAKDTFVLSTPLGSKVIAFEDMSKIIPFSGDSRTLLKPSDFKTSHLKMRGRDLRASTIYYSTIEDPAAGVVYLNYHLFFCFDPKTGTGEKPGLGSHVFDRESISIIISSKTQTPIEVVYNQHQEHQEVGMLNEKNQVVQRWKKGRIRVAWDSVFRIGDHAIAAPAKGSHAIYQAIGLYKILSNGPIRLDLLNFHEPAGGSIKVIRPVNLASRAGFSSYALKELYIDELTSTSAHSFLVSSGFTVDVPGPVDAHFPPFLEREMKATEWVQGAAQWNPETMPASSKNTMQNFIQNF